MKISDIDASLQEGQFFSKGWLFALYYIIGSCVLISIISLIVFFLAYMEIEKIDAENIDFLIISNIVAFLFLCFPVVLLVKNNKLKKKILLWMEDAIVLKAYSTEIDRFRAGGQPISEVKIKVNFVINKQKYTRISGIPGKEDNIFKRNGYYKIFSKYTNREINILYSPKYDQVLILKDR